LASAVPRQDYTSRPGKYFGTMLPGRRAIWHFVW
jgi:hypothetical protein